MIYSCNCRVGDRDRTWVHIHLNYGEKRGYTCQTERERTDLFKSMWNHEGNEGIYVRQSARVCLYACVFVCLSVWLAFLLARYQWVIEGNRHWWLRRQTNYQQVTGSTPTRFIHASLRVCFFSLSLSIFCGRSPNISCSSSSLSTN